MKYIKIFLMALLIGLSSCTYDYNWPDMWIQPNLYISHSLPIYQWAKDYDYELWGADYYYTIVEEGEQPMELKFWKKCSSLNPIILDRGHYSLYYAVVGYYAAHKELYTAVFGPISVDDIVATNPTKDDPYLVTTANEYTLTYAIEDKNPIYISQTLPLEQWATDYGYEYYGCESSNILYDADGDKVRELSNYYTDSEKGYYLEHIVYCYTKTSTEAKQLIFTVTFDDKVLLDDIIKTSPTEDNPYMFATDDKYTITYNVSKKYNFKIGWDQQYIISLLNNYGYEFLEVKGTIQYFDKNGKVLNSSTCNNGGQISVADETTDIQLSIDCYGKKDSYSSKELVYTIVFDKRSVENLLDDGSHTFGATDNCTITYHAYKHYEFKIGWSSAFVQSVLENYGYDILDVKGKVNYLDAAGNVLYSCDYKNQGQISVADETEYIQFSIDLYGRKTSEAFGLKELVCTVAFDKLSVESLASEATHIFGANDHYTITYHVGSASN